MSDFNSDKFAAGIPAQTGVGSEPVVIPAVVTLPAATQLTDGDLLRLCKVPANYSVVGLQPFSDDLDDGETPALVFDIGLLDDGDAALDTVFVSGSTLGQAGGTLAAPATTTMFKTEAASTEKVLAIEVTTTAAGDTPAEAKVGAVVTMVPK